MLAGNEIRDEFLSQHLREPLLARRLASRQGRIEEHPRAAAQAEGHIGTGQRQPLEQARDVSGFGRGAAHELAPRGDVEEKVAHLDRGPGRVRRGAHRAHRARIDGDLGGALRIQGMGDEAKVGYRADRGQRLATKAEGADGGEIIQGGDLARRMPADRDRQLLLGNAAAIVAHAQQLDAAALDVDLDAVRTGVEAVLDELLDDRSRPLDHLAGGDLIDERAREDADGHEGASL